MLSQNQLGDQLNEKIDRLEQSIEQSIEERVKTAFEKCESRNEEAVNKVIEKRIEPKINAIPKKIDSREKSEKHRNVLSSFRVRGLPEDLSKNKEENALLANEKLKEVMKEIGVDVKIDKVQRFGKFDTERTKPRNAIITLSNDWDARIVLAKSSENRARMKEMGIHILPALTAEDAKRENLCLKKRRELLNNSVLPSKLKVRNFELFLDDVKVNVEEQVQDTD